MRSAFKLAALALALGTTATLAEELKFANFMPPTHPYVAGAFDPFAKAVDEATKGEVTVKLYNGGELGAGPVEQYSRVVDGVAELAVSLPGYTASQFPLTLTAELPGMLDEATGTETLWKHLGDFDHDYRRVQLVALWSSAENLLFTRDKPVRNLADVKGLKVRVPSRNTGLLVEAWGGTPVSMPVSEIYNAMQTGVIDAAMIDGTAVSAFKLSEVANYITKGMQTTNSPFFIIMNRDAFDALSPAQQEAVKAAGKQASLDGQKVQLTVAEKGLAAFAKTPGKEVITLDAAAVAEFDAAAAKVTETVLAGTDGAQAVADALKVR
ncbi:TRAP transporter substrate-binding protein [Paracoccus litorisediminis]|uniref:ABC transporter substrate-binding protein n=1 Tax=Paracoccus litorisediminis TaxID=2006130 RepID=A0A844HMD0_9RHOB|nr:TRAP transporter substrate-binding protein [Paracoccus litorisediminis]MTH60239.1 ABC transporter substrate-binding protein [Paracoccus litorisediminis]